MIRFIYNTLHSVAPKAVKLRLEKIKLGYNLLSSEYSYLVETDFVDSFLNKNLKGKSGHVPWMNYSFVNLLDNKLNNNINVFEYGSGSSTMFFAKRCKKITSIEYNKDWFNKIEELIKKEADNASIHFHELNDSYPMAIKEYYSEDNKFDLVIIDGRKRVKCAINSFNCLSEKGVLIFDDSQRPYYEDGIKYYKDRGFKELSIKGLKPTTYESSQSTLLYRENNCLGI